MEHALSWAGVHGATAAATTPQNQLRAGKTRPATAVHIHVTGGTSILIMVGVGLQTIKQLNAQMEQRHYEGLLR